MVKFSKKVDGTYYVVEAAADSSAKKVHVITAYMDKKSGSIIQALNMEQSSPQPTPEAPHGRVASTDTSVSQPGGEVKFADKLKWMIPVHDGLPPGK